MTECFRCGACCTAAFLSLSKEECNQEYSKWLTFHRCDITTEGDRLIVRVPLLCQFITWDSHGVATCTNYENRPQICKDHKCNRLK